VNFGSRLAFNALPAVICEKKSETTLNNKKFAYKIEDPRKNAIINSLIKPSTF
jgi:hypothetical protein